MKAFNKYWAIFQITLINSLAYPGELIGRSLMIIPFMWIFYQLWKVTYAASGSHIISGLTLSRNHHRVACHPRRMDFAFLCHSDDRSLSLPCGGCLCVHVDLSEVGFYLWWHVDPAGFLSALVTGHCKSTPIFKHHLRSRTVIRYANS